MIMEMWQIMLKQSRFETFELSWACGHQDSTNFACANSF